MDGDLLGEHPAHRQADEVGGFDAQHIEDGRGVGGHVAQRVWIAPVPLFHPVRHPRSAVIIADGAVSRVNEGAQERRWPHEAVAAEAHEQQDRPPDRSPRGKALIPDGEAIGLNGAGLAGDEFRQFAAQHVVDDRVRAGGQLGASGKDVEQEGDDEDERDSK